MYTEKFKIGLRGIGRGNTAKNNTLLEMLENIGSYHSDSVNFGANNIDETRTAWILLDWKLEVLNRPKYGQVLTIDTWARGGNKFFVYRDFEIYDEQHNLRAIATSKWALFNVDERKMVKIDEEINDKYEPDEKSVFLDEKLGKIKLPTEFISNMKYQVKRRDIDLNNHMHNLYYLDLAYEALPEEVYNQRPFNNVRISYKKEIVYGDILNCKYTFQDGKHIIVIKNEDESIVHAIVELN